MALRGLGRSRLVDRALCHASHRGLQAQGGLGAPGGRRRARRAASVRPVRRRAPPRRVLLVRSVSVVCVEYLIIFYEFGHICDLHAKYTE